MKRNSIAVLLVLSLLLTLSACGGKKRTESSGSGDKTLSLGSTSVSTGNSSGNTKLGVTKNRSNASSTSKISKPGKNPGGNSVSSVSSKPDSLSLQTFKVPNGTPRGEILFRVTVNGKEVGLYSDFNAWDEYVNFGYFNFDPGYKAKVTIEAKFKFNRVEVLPAKYGVKASVSGRKVSFTIDKPNKDLTFVFDGKYKGTVLHLFTNPIDHNEPTESTDDLIYVGPGYYDLSSEGYELEVGSNKTLYIAGGAVINGSIIVKYSKNVKIKGSGVVMMSRKNGANPQYGNVVVQLNNSSNVEISGIIAQAYRSQNWTTHVYFTNNVSFDRYRVVSTRYASVDALDISNCQNITVKNCFLRSCDDCITIKGLAGTVSPSLASANAKIHVSDTILWNDCNNAMVLGEESMAKYYDDISFKNIDVLFSYDDVDHHGQLDERSAISIVCLHGTYFKNIIWENIRVNQCERLICFTFKDSFWFGSIKGNQSFPGGISGVKLKNITSTSTSKSKIANEIILNGWSNDKKISKVNFNNVVINGSKVKSLNDPHFAVKKFLGSITFS